MARNVKGLYHYTECGLDDVYLENGFSVTKEGVLINDIPDLHRAIALLLVSKAERLSAKEIRFIRHILDFSQTTLAKILGVSYQSVLGWEKGKSKIQKPTENLLRTLIYSYFDNSNKSVYDKINELADLDAAKGRHSTIVFKEVSDEWKQVA